MTYTITVLTRVDSCAARSAAGSDLAAQLDALAEAAELPKGASGCGSPVSACTGNLTLTGPFVLHLCGSRRHTGTATTSERNTVTSAAPGSNCGAGSTDPRCAAVTVAH